MLNMLEQLENLDSRGWNNLFSYVDKEERKSISHCNNNLLYRYLGEIDNPEEMLQDFATMEDIKHCGGKSNWFICSDETFYTCGDCATDSLFESGKVVDYNFPFETERNRKYNFLSKEEKILFRVNLQGITEVQAREIVCYELGIPAYKNIYIFSVEEILLDTFNGSEEIKFYTFDIEADTEEEAIKKFVSESQKVGSIVHSGKRFTEEDNQKMRESGKIFGYKGGTPYTIILKHRNIVNIEVKENHGYWN